MINFYVSRIQNDVMTIEQVPLFWRARVQKALERLEIQVEETQNE